MALARWLEKLQGRPFYRKIRRLFNARTEIKEATSNSALVTNFFAQKGRRIIGSAQLIRFPLDRQTFRGYWGFSLKVELSFRGMGIAESLHRARINKAKAEGAKELFLLVRENNFKAIALNHKLGFTTKVIPGLEEKLAKEKPVFGYRRIVMSKRLLP